MKFSISVIAPSDPIITKKCVDSILRHSQDFELLLTDNGSTDGVTQLFVELSAEHPNVRVIRNERNMGFSRPHAKALELSVGKFFVLLNNDAVVPPMWLHHLELPLLENPSGVISGPRGGCTFLDGHFVGHMGSLDYIEGACMMVKADVVKKHGLFAPHLFFAYSEDADLCLRMRQLGYTIHEANFVLEHTRGHTSRKMKIIPAIKEQNHYASYPRWQFYLNSRRMDYPIVVRRKGAIGDVILTTAVIRELKKRHPLSPIHVETGVPEVFKGNPDVASAAPVIHETKPRLVNLNMAYENQPMTHYLTAYQRAAWIEDDIEKKLRLYPSEVQMRVATVRIPDNKWIAIHVGPSSWKGRNWSAERFNELAKILMMKGYNVVLVGHSNCGVTYFHQDLCGKTGILDLAAILSKCLVTITIDSGPLHVAQAMRCPVVGLFGVSLPEFVITDGSPSINLIADQKQFDCVGIRHRVPGQVSFECPDGMMDTISVESVVNATEELINKVTEPVFA